MPSLRVLLVDSDESGKNYDAGRANRQQPSSSPFSRADELQACVMFGYIFDPRGGSHRIQRFFSWIDDSPY
jgi:hypothetical protein